MVLKYTPKHVFIFMQKSPLNKDFGSNLTLKGLSLKNLIKFRQNYPVFLKKKQHYLLHIFQCKKDPFLYVFWFMHVPLSPFPVSQVCVIQFQLFSDPLYSELGEGHNKASKKTAIIM